MPDSSDSFPPTGFCHLLDDKGIDDGRSQPAAGELRHAGGDSLPARSVVLELRVRNHPGTMSHITGLFARRAFNLDAIACAPLGDGSTSCILLLVAGGSRLEQVGRQLERLHDVLTVRLRPDLNADYFARLVTPAAG